MNFPPIPEIPEPMRGKSFAIVEAVALLGEAEATEVLAPLRNSAAGDGHLRAQPPAGISGLHMDPPDPVALRRPTGCC